MCQTSALMVGRLKAILQILATLLFCGFILFGTVGCDCPEGATPTAFGPDCGDSPTSGETSGGGSGSGVLIVSDQAANNLRRFQGVSTLNSSIATDLPLSGPATRLTRPGFLTLGPQSGQLVVCDAGSQSVAFFDDPMTVMGDVPPARILTGPNTKMVAPTQAYFDSVKNELWVLDKGASKVFVYPGGTTIDSDVAPLREIGGPQSGIQNPAAFIIRPANAQLIVINPSEVLTFSHTESLQGDPAPTGRVSGAATTFKNLAFGAFDASNGLVLVDAGTRSILYFQNFEPAKNNQAPTHTISGANSGISSPGQFVLTADVDMYLANGSNVLFFKNVLSLNGDVFPDRKFSAVGPASQGIRGLFML